MSARDRRPQSTTSPPVWRTYGWWIGAVAGLLAGTGVAVLAHEAQEAREARDLVRRAEAFDYREDVPPPVDAVRDLLAQDTLVVVDPLLADRVPEADLRRAEELLAGSPVPARIAFLRSPQGLHEGYTSRGAATQWWTALGERGHYVVLEDNGSTEYGAVGLVEQNPRTRTQGQPGPALVRLAEEMATWEAQPLPTEPDAISEEDYWGGISGGILAAVLFGGLGVVPVFLVLRWFVGTRRRKET